MSDNSRISTRRRTLAAFAIVLTCVVTLGALAGVQETPTTVRAGVLIDGTGEIMNNVRLFIEDGVITRVDRLRGAVTFDLSNLVVMPGWIDTHTHLTAHFDPDGMTHRDNPDETEAQTMLYAVGNARRALMAGFTTVQSLGSPLAARGKSPASHRDRCGGRIARHDEGKYWAYLTEEHRREAGCRAGQRSGTFTTGC